MLPSEVPRLATDTPVKVFPGVWKLLSLLRLPSQDKSPPCLFCLSLYLLYFFLPPFEDNGLLFWVPDVLCQHSEVVLWNLLSIQIFFWWICGGDSGLPVIFLRHLRTAPQLSHPYIILEKKIALTIWTFVCKVISVLFNMLSRLVIAFIPRSKCLLISWLQSPSIVILEIKNINTVTASSFYPSICHEVMGPDAMILVFECWVLKNLFHSPLSDFIKWLFTSSLSAIRVVSSAYLRLLIFLLAVLNPTCTSSSPAFLMMYPAYELNKQGDNIRPYRTSFPLLSHSVAPWLSLTIASWLAYRRLLRRQVR